MKTFICPLLLVLFAWAGAPAHAGEPLDNILSRVAAAYGAQAPNAIREAGTTISFRQGNGVLTRLYAAPDRFRIEIRYASRIESRTMAGKQAWQQGEPANPVLRNAIALQAARIALPWNMLERRAALADLGEVAGTEGKTLRAVEFSVDQQIRMVVEIDPHTGHILRSRGIQSLGTNSMEFATVYSDFRRRGGRAHAAREDHYAMGQHTGYSLIDEVEYPARIPDDAFRP